MAPAGVHADSAGKYDFRETNGGRLLHGVSQVCAQSHPALPEWAMALSGLHALSFESSSWDVL